MRERLARALLGVVLLLPTLAGGSDAPITLWPRLEAWTAGERIADAAREPGQGLPLSPGVRLGEVEISGEWLDYRGQRIAGGRYGLRYALQPRLKDHSGVDAERDFALLVPLDAGPVEPGAPEDWIAVSRRVAGTRHPAVMALRSGERARAGSEVRVASVAELVIGFVVAGQAESQEAF